MTEKCLRKIIRQLLLIFYILNKRKYVLPLFQKLTWIVKNKQFSRSQFSIIKIPNEEEENWHYLPVKKLPALLKEQHQNSKVTFIV